MKKKNWNKKLLKIICLFLIIFNLITINKSFAFEFPEDVTDVGWEGTLDVIVELNDVEEYYDSYYINVANYLKRNGYIPEDSTKDYIIDYIEKNASLIKVYLERSGLILVQDCLITKPGSVSSDTDDSQTHTSTGGSSSSGSGTLDDMFDAADDFMNSGLQHQGEVIVNDNLQDTSNFMYNVLLAIAIVVAVVCGMLLGIKFLTGAAEQRAETKKALIPYFVGCVVVFAAFGIWSFAVNILQSIY